MPMPAVMFGPVVSLELSKPPIPMQKSLMPRCWLVYMCCSYPLSLFLVDVTALEGDSLVRTAAGHYVFCPLLSSSASAIF